MTASHHDVECTGWSPPGRAAVADSSPDSYMARVTGVRAISNSVTSTAHRVLVRRSDSRTVPLGTVTKEGDAGDMLGW